LNEALEIRGLYKTTVLAGGSDLMVRHRTWSGVVPEFHEPILLIGHLPELQEVSIGKDFLNIGAGCTLANLLCHPLIPDYVKLPISQMASPSIRNMATIGGNICNSSPAGDTLPMLYALEAQLSVQAYDHQHTVAMADFITGPGRNILTDQEILSHITIPVSDYNHLFYKKVGSRQTHSISKVSFYGVAHGDETKLHQVKMCLGAVGPTVIRSMQAETILQGIDKAQIPECLEAVRTCFTDLIKPINDIRSTGSYRQTVSMRLVDYFLMEVLKG